ncbi:hypothetical protein MHK_004976, partial [Candidatus Magnetomorum sp. HK-1]
LATVLSASYQNYHVFNASIDVKEIETIEQNIQLMPNLSHDLNKNNYLGLADVIYGLNILAKHGNSDGLLNEQVTLTNIMTILDSMCH